MNAEEIIAEGEAFATNEDAFDDLIGPAELIENLAKIARAYHTTLLYIAKQYGPPFGDIAREALERVHALP
jgi:hypothetical protein